MQEANQLFKHCLKLEGIALKALNPNLLRKSISNLRYSVKCEQGSFKCQTRIPDAVPDILSTVRLQPPYDYREKTDQSIVIVEDKHSRVAWALQTEPAPGWHKSDNGMYLVTLQICSIQSFSSSRTTQRCSQVGFLYCCTHFSNGQC